MSGLRDYKGRLQLMGLVVITPAGGARGRGHLEVAKAALQEGCGAVQLRDKSMTDRSFGEVASRMKAECARFGALMFINDRVDVALAVGCDGVHLGVDDLPVEDARKILPAHVLIGYSPEGPQDGALAVKRGADYLGVGPVYPTPSKPDAGRAIGTVALGDYCRTMRVPVIAVGGINAGNAASAIAAGAAGVAVSSAVAGAVDMEAVLRDLLGEIAVARAEAVLNTGGIQS